jgi:hypothetical protein
VARQWWFGGAARWRRRGKWRRSSYSGGQRAAVHGLSGGARARVRIRENGGGARMKKEKKNNLMNG